MAAGAAVRIAILADAGPAKKALDDVAASAPKVQKSFDDLGESTDQTATKTGILASAMGAFAGGLEAVGLEKYAGVLTGASVATDVFSNASDVATLALQSKYVAAVKDRAATIASATAQKATAVASKAYAAAQWLVNAALTANPIGLVIVALVAIGAALVLAYKKSETFRKVVDGAFAAVKVAVNAVVSFFKMLAPWISKAVGAVSGLLTGKGKDIVLGLINGYNAVIGGVATFFKGLPGKIVGFIGNVNSLLYNAGSKLISGLADGMMSKLSVIKEKAGSIAQSIKDFFPGSPVKAGPLRAWNNGGAGTRLVGFLTDGLAAQTASAGRAAGRLAEAVTGGFGEVALSPSLALGNGGSASASGDVVVYVEIDGEQLQGRITNTVRDSNRALKRKTRQG
jgi:phage-related protein